MKSTGKSKYVGKYKRLFLILKRCLNVQMKIIASIITHVEVKLMTKIPLKNGGIKCNCSVLRFLLCPGSAVIFIQC